jgi:hypothetical protein
LPAQHIELKPQIFSYVVATYAWEKCTSARRRTGNRSGLAAQAIGMMEKIAAG